MDSVICFRVYNFQKIQNNKKKRGACESLQKSIWFSLIPCYFQQSFCDSNSVLRKIQFLHNNLLGMKEVLQDPLTYVKRLSTSIQISIHLSFYFLLDTKSAKPFANSIFDGSWWVIHKYITFFSI